MDKVFHARTARVLARKLNLDKYHEEIFVKAILAPDKWRKKNPRRRHHTLKPNVILYHVFNARSHYLRDEIDLCLYELGIALHYLQDSFIPSPRSRYLRKIHASIERKARDISLDYIKREVDDALRESQSSYAYVSSLVYRVERVYDPELAIREAIRTSALITAAVFGPRTPPPGLIERFRIAKERYAEKSARATRISLIILSISVLLSLALIALNCGGLASFTLLISLISTALFYMNRSFDPEYFEIAREASWYGLV